MTDVWLLFGLDNPLEFWKFGLGTLRTLSQRRGTCLSYQRISILQPCDKRFDRRRRLIAHLA